ncbi:MAG: Bcr/CflA family efflux MFS transporter [Simkaniaceae bacterium]|nr:Bcr/CflA family efflux MFS transporter [Simkaniaceae bacterium]
MKWKSLFLFPILLIIYEFAINMSNDMYIPALVQIQSDLNTTDRFVGFTITAWLLGSSSIDLLLGPLSDKHGRRPVIFFGGFIFILATFFCAQATTIWSLLIARYFQGMAVSSLMVAGYASIHELYEERRAIHILSYMGCAAIVAPMIGPLIGGYVLIYLGWRAIFYILLSLALLALIGLVIVMPESNQNLSQERLHVSNLVSLYSRILRNWRYLASAFPAGLLYAGIIMWITISPFLLIQELNVAPQHFGLWQIFVFSAYIVGAQTMKLCTKFILPDGLASIGLIAAIVGSISLLFLFKFATIFSLIGPMMLFAFGCGFSSAPLTRLTLTSTEERMGAMSALFYLKMAAIGALLSFLVSILYHGTPLPFALILVSASLLAGAMHLLRPVKN